MWEEYWNRYLGRFYTVRVDVTAAGSSASPVSDESVATPISPVVAADPSFARTFSVIPVFEGAHPGWTGYPGGEWQFPDTANTSSTEDFLFAYGFAPMEAVEWILIWQPSSENQFARLVQMPMAIEDGYGTWHEVASIRAAADQYGWGARSHRADLTTAMNDLRLDRKNRYFGLQIWGDGRPMTIWKSRIRILWAPVVIASLSEVAMLANI